MVQVYQKYPKFLFFDKIRAYIEFWFIICLWGLECLYHRLLRIQNWFSWFSDTCVTCFYLFNRYRSFGIGVKLLKKLFPSLFIKIRVLNRKKLFQLLEVKINILIFRGINGQFLLSIGHLRLLRLLVILLKIFYIICIF